LAASNGVSQARILKKPHEIRHRGSNWNVVLAPVRLGDRGLPGYWLAPGEISWPAMRVACGLLAVFCASIIHCHGRTWRLANCSDS
jgi:hypothetical protein